MKISLCVYGSIGYNLFNYCIKQDRQIELVVVKEKDPWAEKTIKECEQSHIPYYVVKNINTDHISSALKSSSIDLCLLLWWPDIIREKLLDSVNIGFINLHPSLLPYNRGMNPYYWSIVNDTPAGVSIHFIDSEIDGGSLLYQKRIETSITTTGEQLYELNKKAIVRLFMDNYQEIINISEVPDTLDVTGYPIHYLKDLKIHSQIDLDKSYTGREIIDIIRARTFENGESSYFLYKNKKYFVRIKIEEDKK
tara:strand:- start:15797 stop:16549 length:753 start_codon:yes stop_codon:yes gene_type:complete